MSRHVEVIEAALRQYAGDDAARARRAFQGQDMNEPWGQSGRTRAEVLAGYEKHEAEVEAALAWVRTKA